MSLITEDEELYVPLMLAEFMKKMGSVMIIFLFSETFYGQVCSFSVMLSYCSVLFALDYAIFAFWGCELFLLLIFLCLLMCWQNRYYNSVPSLWLY